MTRNVCRFHSRVRWIVYGLYAGIMYLLYGMITHALGVGTWNLW